MELKNFIDSKSHELSLLETLAHQAWWDLAVTGDERYERHLEETKKKIGRLLSSKKDYDYLVQEKDPADPLLKREKKLLINSYKENQIDPELIDTIVTLETEIEAIYTNFRAEVNGIHLPDNELKRILVESNDQEKRKAAWEASKKLGTLVEGKVKQLISLRNQAAKQAGFSDFYTMRLELQELDEKHLFDLLHQLDLTTTSSWENYKPRLDNELAARFKISPADLMPWHYHDLFFQEAPQQAFSLDPIYKNVDLVSAATRFYDSIGLHVQDIMNRSDLFEREKKNQHAFCMCIDRRQNIRMLCNLRSTEYWMSTLLHELGHAVYDKYIDQSLPFLLRTTAHTSTTEAIAMLFGRLSKNKRFLHQYASVPLKEAEKIESQVKSHSAAALLVFARWILVMTHFERAMYQQPDANLNTLWWDLVEQYQWVNRIPGRNQPDWASKLHLACAPVYYQNYILGEMTASQLHHALKDSMNPGTGEWLKQRIFSQGAKAHWELTLQKATGEMLNPQYFAADCKV